jgi:ABC-type branched-subunit amino acid transport system substrate-binding protein
MRHTSQPADLGGTRHVPHARAKVAIAALACVLAACGARLSPAQLRAASGTGSGTGSGGVTAGNAGGADQSGGAATGGTGTGAGSAGASGTGSSGQPGSAGGSSNVIPAPAGGNGGATDVGVTATDIELGNVSTITGPVPGLFKGAVVGAQAYIAYQNSLGGVYGRKLHLQVGDDGLDAAQNKSQVDQLIPKVFAFLGSFSIQDQAGAPDMQSAGVPDVGYSLSHARGDIAVNFSPQPLGHGWRLGPLNYFKQMFGPSVITKVAYYYEDAQSAKDVATAQKEAMASDGYQVVAGRQIEPNEANFTGDVLQMEQKGVKAVMLSGEVGTMARMAKAMHDQGFSVPFANWGASAYDPAFIPGSGGGAEGALLDQQLALYAGEDSGVIPEVALYLKWLHQISPDQSTDIFSAFSWASGKLLVDALKAAGPKLTRPAMLNALKGIHTFDDNGFVALADPGAKGPPTCWLAIKVQGGKFVRFNDPAAGYRCNDGGYFHGS